MKNTFYYIACIGFILTFGAHVLSFGDVQPGPGLWIFGAGVLVVMFAFVLRLRRENPVDANSSSRGLRITMNRLFIHAPKWMRTAAIVVFVYAVINFVYVMVIRPANPDHITITLLDMRMFTGHWMAFYAISAAGLYPAKDSAS